MANPSDDPPAVAAVPKIPTGIAGLDEVMAGGLPRGRVSLVCGGPGTGKSLLALQFLMHGARERGEAGLFVSFEETADELAQNTASFGWDVAGLVDGGQLAVEYVRADPGELTQAGAYDLEALFVRVGHAADSIGAQHVVLDSIETLFGALGDEALVRRELQRLFGWLKGRGVTAIVTAERSTGDLTRHGLEEYVSDCVIVLDHRIRDETSTRRLRIIKYRGSLHGVDEYPFIIDGDGFSVFPLTSMARSHEASEERISTGVDELDAMAGGGYWRGSTTLISGAPGTAKTTLAAAFAAATCLRGERCLYLALEESQTQLVRNVRSVGIDLEPLASGGTLRIVSRRPTSGLEAHLATIQKEVIAFEPEAVILDPVSAFGGQEPGVTALLARILDFLQLRGITTLMTLLEREGSPGGLGISSLADTWIALFNVERAGERNRAITVIKSRGTAQSNQMREFVLSGDGVEVLDAYTGEGGLLMGSAREEAEAREHVEFVEQEQALTATQRRSQARHAALAAQIAVLEAELGAEQAGADTEAREQEGRQTQLYDDEQTRARRRASGPPGGQSPP